METLAQAPSRTGSGVAVATDPTGPDPAHARQQPAVSRVTSPHRGGMACVRCAVARYVNRSQAAAVLGVADDAPAAQVESAFREQARLLHPDRWALFGASERAAAAAAMERLNEAREVMLDVRRTPRRPATAERGDGVGSPIPDLRPQWGAEQLRAAAATIRDEWGDFADNPYAPYAWLVLATVALLTGLIGFFWLFLALAAWSYLRQRRAAGLT